MSMPNGDIYNGMFSNGKKNGRGILKIHKAKKILDGYWENDEFVDSVIFWYSFLLIIDKNFTQE